MRKILLLPILLFITASKAWGYSSIMASTVKDVYGGKADSLAFCLIDQFMNTSKGTFWSTPKDIAKDSRYIYWQQAHAIDVLVYAYERHKGDSTGLDRTYRTYISRWYTNKANNYAGAALGNGYRMFENPYTDDMCWICLTLLHMTEATGLGMYANAAKSIFDNYIMKRAQEDETGLWLPWNTDAGSKANACTMSPACLIAAKLYEKYETEKYLEYAEKFYTYLEKNIVKTDGRVEEPPLTYTQGTFAEACRRLYHIILARDGVTTLSSKYKNKAQLYINYAFTSGRCTNGANILRDEGPSMDQSIFKAVLIPYAVNFILDEKMNLTVRRALSTYVQKNANTLWKVLDKDTYPKMYCPYDWTKAYDTSKTASMGAMVSGASLFENCARMCEGLTYKPEDTTSIEDIHINDEVNLTGAYSLDGRLVRTPWQSTDNLPSGIYVINGRKVYIP